MHANEDCMWRLTFFIPRKDHERNGEFQQRASSLLAGTQVATTQRARHLYPLLCRMT